MIRRPRRKRASSWRSMSNSPVLKRSYTRKRSVKAVTRDAVSGVIDAANIVFMWDLVAARMSAGVLEHKTVYFNAINIRSYSLSILQTREKTICGFKGAGKENRGVSVKTQKNEDPRPSFSPIFTITCAQFGPSVNFEQN